MDKRKHERLIELGKDVLIVLLACSALWMAVKTFLAEGFRQEDGGTGVSLNGGEEQSGAVWPVRMAVTWQDEGSVLRCGVQYDSGECDRLFQPVASLLREALSSAGAARPVTEREWRQMLGSSTNLYFDFLGEIPLSILCGWLSGTDSALQGTVRRVALAAEGEQVTLYYLDEETGTYYASTAEVVSAGQLRSAAEGVTDNGAAFAFEMEQYAGLDGNTMILTERPKPRVYAAADPLSGEGQAEEINRAGLEQLLQALSFPDSSYIYSGTDQVIRSGNDTLRISVDGVVRYSAAEGEQSRYLVPAREGRTGLSEAAEVCRQLAQAAVGGLAGEARIYLQGVTQTGAGWEIVFAYCLDGIPVQVGTAGYAACFQVEGEEITQFTLQLRSYTDTGSRSIVLPEQQAAAALEAMEKQGSELTLAYQDQRNDTVNAGWVAG